MTELYGHSSNLKNNRHDPVIGEKYDEDQKEIEYGIPEHGTWSIRFVSRSHLQSMPDENKAKK